MYQHVPDSSTPVVQMPLPHDPLPSTTVFKIASPSAWNLFIVGVAGSLSPALQRPEHSYSNPLHTRVWTSVISFFWVASHLCSPFRVPFIINYALPPDPSPPAFASSSNEVFWQPFHHCPTDISISVLYVPLLYSSRLFQTHANTATVSDILGNIFQRKKNVRGIEYRFWFFCSPSRLFCWEWPHAILYSLPQAYTCPLLYVITSSLFFFLELLLRKYSYVDNDYSKHTHTPIIHVCFFSWCWRNMFISFLHQPLLLQSLFALAAILLSKPEFRIPEICTWYLLPVFIIHSVIIYKVRILVISSRVGVSGGVLIVCYRWGLVTYDWRNDALLR